MRLAVQQNRNPVAVEKGETRLSAFGESLKRSPSQKELAGILMVTTRHLRRWEMDEEAANRPCSRPYTHADLWHLYQRRGRKGWDRVFAVRLGLADIFERFDRIRVGPQGSDASDARTTTAAMMLRSMATDGEGSLEIPDAIPRVFGTGLAQAAKAQLRVIVDCEPARAILVKAFFEAALVAEAKQFAPIARAESPAALSA